MCVSMCIYVCNMYVCALCVRGARACVCRCACVRRRVRMCVCGRFPYMYTRQLMFLTCCPGITV